MKRLKDISIAKKLYFIVGAMAVLIIFELLTLWFAIHTLSSVRALVGAEGLWSKAQKDAVYQLRKYNVTHDEKDFKKYQQFMAVPMGDHKTRMELFKPDPDLAICRQGFIEGRVHPDDIDGMIKLLRRFHSNYYIANAINAWSNADSALFFKLMPVAETFHTEMNSSNPSKVKLDQLMGEIDLVNEQLTVLEDNFSYTLGDGSRWLENLILKILLSVAFTVEFTGLFLTFLVTRGISKELKEIEKATSKVTRGDLTARAKVLSQNEIGHVAAEVNQMTEQLVLSNRELGQVAYIASHDLQEPLRTISNFVVLLQKQYEGKLGADADEYLAFISEGTLRMQLLVKDLLDYSRIGNDKKMVKIDCNKEVQNVLKGMTVYITENAATIDVGKLPVVDGYFELQYLFQNLIGNAIKYKKKDVDPIIKIEAKDNGKEWLFSVKDNGIGINKKYHQRIFTIFQKLHSDREYAGTGIGLAHCKKIAELHRGNIWLESEEGQGATFYFTIPKQTNNGN
ncbi:sensor histidine kinase [Ferruginibacter sp. SUN002]|uniref:sensor histidine kinase n=1 Tax=Ferruginibacter sp. SUN002 TaxID=2937789 RepID=UPI003D35EA87